MNSSVLHITNGDNTTNLLNKLHFSGDFITWREMLCEGKTITQVGSEKFWKTRYDFLKSSYKIPKKTFIDSTLKEYRKLCNQKQQDHIVLWFEHNLFSQINMLAVISWLHKYRTKKDIFIVQSGKIGRSTKLKSFSELTENQIKKLYKNKIKLSTDDIEYADYIWELYCSDNPLRLETVHKFNPMSPFVYLEDTIKAHLLRFPSVKNGLNQIENLIVTSAEKEKTNTKEQLVKTLLKDTQTHGFTDVQYTTKIDELKKLFTSFNPLKLSKIGKKVLTNQINYYGQIRNDFSYLGGTKKYNYLYVNDTNKLLKITS